MNLTLKVGREEELHWAPFGNKTYDSCTRCKKLNILR